MVAEVEVRELAAAQRAVMGYLATYPHGYLQMGYSRKIRRGSPGWLRSGALAGARVVVSGRNRERSDEVVAMITGAGGLAYVVPADLADARNLGVAGPQATSIELIPPSHTVILDGAKITLPIYGDAQ